MNDLRLGDVIDDFCVKCRRLTNHSVVSLMDGQAAKVRCRTCYSDHDYRHEQPPPSKKDLKKAALFNEVLTKAAPAAAGDPPVDASPADPSLADPSLADPAPADSSPEISLAVKKARKAKG